MENAMQIFNNVEFGQVRTVVINNEPYFVGKDVAEALGYAKPENAISNHVDDEDKTTTLIQGTGSNYKSNAVCINEPASRRNGLQGWLSKRLKIMLDFMPHLKYNKGVA